jgi:predicted DNA-binding transcriptional regulator AlpA
MDALLTPPQLSDRTGFALSTLANWRSRGGGPEFIRKGGRIFYREAAVDEWLDDDTFTRTHERAAS